jgi:hypothetical protein
MDRRTLLFGFTGSALVWKTMLMAAKKTPPGLVLISAGRRVDAADATVARFPSGEVTEVRHKIQEFFAREMPRAAVCSAACGADLLVLDVARSHHTERFVLLPSEQEEFRKTSVTDRPGNWGELYDRVLKSSKVEILKLPEGQEGYLETNLKLLDRGQELARKYSLSAAALVVWNKESRGADDVTAHFLEQAKLRDIPITEISTLRPAR